MKGRVEKVVIIIKPRYYKEKYWESLRRYIVDRKLDAIRKSVQSIVFGNVKD